MATEYVSPETVKANNTSQTGLAGNSKLQKQTLTKKHHPDMAPPRKKKSSIKYWEIDLTFTEPQVETLPTVASYDEIPVEEFLTNEIIRYTESLLENPGCIGDMAIDKLRHMWKTGKPLEQENSRKTDLLPYRAKLALASGQISVIRSLAEMEEKSVEQYLSEILKLNISSTIGARMDIGMVPYDEAIKLYRIWDGDDPSYYKK